MKKLEIDKSVFLEEYNKGLNDVELSQIFSCSRATIANYRKVLDLDSNFEYPNSITIEQLQEYVNQGLSDYKISDITGINHSWIFQLRKKHNIQYDSLRENKSVQLTKRQEEILIGHILGDGNLRKLNVNVSGKIEQGYKQKEYAEWKYEELRSLCSYFKHYVRKTIDPRTGIYYESYGANLIANPELNKYYDMSYKDSVKYISNEIMELFTPLSLAVLFMDDGYKSRSSYALCTQCFDLNSLIILKNKLNEFGINSSIYKSGELHIKTSSRDLFTYLIKPYIIPSMEYKLH